MARKPRERSYRQRLALSVYAAARPEQYPYGVDRYAGAVAHALRNQP
jgi:hypothetical protein